MREVVDMSKAVAELIDEVKASVDGRRQARQTAHVAAVKAVRQIETAIVAALNGGVLLGLRNFGSGVEPFYAARVRTRSVASRRPRGGKPVLVLVDTGHLAIMSPTAFKSVASVPAKDSDLQVEDVEAVLRTLTEVLPRHLLIARERCVKFDRIHDLIDRVMKVLMADAPVFTVTPPKAKKVIPAEAHSDCYRVAIEFDALHWFTFAGRDEIVALAACGWGGDYPADRVAEHFRDGALKLLFDFLAMDGLTMPDSRDPVGFEVYVNEEAAMAWLRQNRPETVAAIAAATEK